MTDKPEIVAEAVPHGIFGFGVIKARVDVALEVGAHLIRLIDHEAAMLSMEPSGSYQKGYDEGRHQGTKHRVAEIQQLEASRAADKARIAELVRERDGLLKDKARLDYLDQMNESLNAHYGTTYKWKLVLSPNVTRLMTGRQNNGYVGDIDLHDSDALGQSSCREAIDEALAQQGKEGGA